MNPTKEAIIEAVQEAFRPLEARLDRIEARQREMCDALERRLIMETTKKRRRWSATT